MKVGQKLRIEGITYTIKYINSPTSENGKRRQEIELSVLTGYLVCQKCKGYYKLKPGESPEDFTNTCTCGGKLRYAKDIELVGSKKKLDENEPKKDAMKIYENNRGDIGKWLLQARGTTGMVELYTNGVLICTTDKSSFKALHNFHFKNTDDYEKYFIYARFVSFDEIDYVIYKEAKLLSAGYMRFILHEDGIEKRKLTDNSDEKQIGFRPNQQPMFDKIHEIIESKINKN